MADERQHHEEINWDAHARMDPTLRWMIKNKVPLTRENYIDIAYEQEPKDWNAEHEAALPYPFQLHSE